MRVFHDSDRNRWELKLTLGAAKRVFDETGVDLLNPTKIGTDGRTVLQKLVTGDLLVGGVVFAMIGDQIRERKLDEKEVYDAFDAATITAMCDAFFAELRDFFIARGREYLAKALEEERPNAETVDKKIAAATGTLGSKLRDLPDAQTVPVFES